MLHKHTKRPQRDEFAQQPSESQALLKQEEDDEDEEM